MSQKVEQPVQKERETVNTNFYPEQSFRIRKRYGSRDCFGKLLSQLWKQQQNSRQKNYPLGLRPNILLRMEGVEFFVHDIVLAAFSDDNAAWHHLLTQSTTNSTTHVLDLTKEGSHLTVDGMKKVLQYLYEGKISFDVSIVPQVLAVAAFFEIIDLKKQMGEYLLRIARTNRSLLPLCLDMCFTNDLPPDVKERFVNLGAESFADLLTTNNGRDLFDQTGDVVEALLSSDDLNAPSPIEVTVFEFIISWLKVNYKDAPKYASSLLDTCRFSHMTTEDKFRCLKRAQQAGLDVQVRSKIMDADWENTCQEWNQLDKADNLTPCRKLSPRTTVEKRAPTSKVQAKPESSDNAVRENIGQEKLDEKTDIPEEEKSEPQRIKRSAKSRKSNASSSDRRRQRSKKEKGQQRRRQELEKRRRQSESAEKPLGGDVDNDAKIETKEAETSEEDPDLVTAKELFKSSKSSKAKLTRTERKRLRKLAKKRKKREARKRDRNRTKPEQKFPSGVENLSIKDSITLFSALLNKKGRRLLQSSLMNPEFSDTFRRAIRTSRGDDTKDERTPSVTTILERPNPSSSSADSHDSGFLYSPESTDYQSYLEETKKHNVSKRVSANVGDEAPKKTIDGGRPLSLMQSVRHRKTDNSGNDVIIEYEQKCFASAVLHEPVVSKKLNKLSFK